MEIYHKNAWRVYRKLLLIAKPYASFFLLAVLATLAASAMDAAIAYYIAPFIDGMDHANSNINRYMPLILLLIFTLRAILSFYSDYFTQLTGTSVVKMLRDKIFTKILSIPASVHDRKSRAEIMAYIVNNVNLVFAATTTVLLTLLKEGTLVAFLIIVMFSISWQLSLLSILVTPIVVLVVRYFSARLKILSYKGQNSIADLVRVVEQSSSAFKLICVFGTKNREIERFEEANSVVKRILVKQQIDSSLSSAIVQFLIAIPLSLGVMMVMSTNHAVTVGGFTAIIVIMARILGPIKTLSKVNAPLQNALAATNRIFDLLGIDDELDEGEVCVDALQGDIVFDDVTFSYAHNVPVLKNISFTIEAGKTVAFVGSSGAGKTSIINLLPRLYRVDSGVVYLDGHDVNSYKLDNLRQHFSYVGQNVQLFRGSIYDNIVYGCVEIPTESRLQHVLEASNCTPFINKLPKGVHTLVGDDGELLSGGQRQRLAIARAMLKDAPIIILDEATSALDSFSENHIRMALDHLCTNKTVIIIAHRLSTVRNVDCIHVLNDGAIVESGTHEALMQQNGLYQKMIQAQYSEEDNA